MADIQKKLKLVAELDDRKVKRQIEQLKKDLEGLSLKGQDLSGFTKSANILKDAARELKEAVNQFKRVSPQRINAVTGTPGAGQGGVQTPRRQRQQEQVREVFDPEARGGRGRNVRLRGEQEYSFRTQTVYRNQQQRLEAERRYKIKTQEIIAKKEEQAAARRRQRDLQAQEAERRQQERFVRGGLTAAGRQFGIGLPQSRQIVETVGGRLEGGFTGFGRRIGRGAYRGMRRLGMSRGAARGAMGIAGRTGAALGVAGAVIGAGALGVAGYNNFIQAQQERRQLQAQAEQEEAFGLIEGTGLTAAQMRGAREEGQTGFRGFAAGVGSTMSDLFSLNIGAAVTGESFRRGRLEAGGREVETREAEMRLALEAGNRARAMRDIRFGAMRGGGVSGQDLTGLQAQGAAQGFGISETLQQFTQARQFLGNRGARRNLQAMQDIFNRTGTSVGAQAQAAEIFTGAQGGQTFDRGQQQTVDILKKGVAAGLDASKTQQFLKTTADYVQQQQGLGDIDVEAISTRLSDFAQGFAGGGDVTETNLRQAQQLAAIQRAESTSMSGLSGIGNITGIQQAFQGAGANLDTGTFLALTNLSQDADEDDIRTILRDSDLGDISEEQREQLIQNIQQSRQDTQARGADLVFGQGNRNLSRFFRGRERGLTTEQQLGAEEAETQRAFNRRLRDRGMGAEGQLPEVPRGEELRSRIVEAQQQQATFVQGMEVMATRTNDAAQNMGRLNEELKKVINSFQQYQRSTVSRQGGGG